VKRRASEIVPAILKFDVQPVCLLNKIRNRGLPSFYFIGTFF
jgi:hypothetical protein